MIQDVSKYVQIPTAVGSFMMRAKVAPSCTVDVKNALTFGRRVVTVHVIKINSIRGNVYLQGKHNTPPQDGMQKLALAALIATSALVIIVGTASDLALRYHSAG